VYPVKISSTSERYRHDIVINDKFHLTSDEPLEVGGDDKGPTPLDFVLAGLGSCKAITVKMYAERKGWELTSVNVDVVSEKETIPNLRSPARRRKSDSRAKAEASRNCQ